MSRINEGDIVKTLTPGMNTKFYKAVQDAPKEWPQVADFVRSTQAIETYPFLGGLPAPVPFEGERKKRKFAEYSFAITNGEWEQTVTVKRSTLDDDQYGQLERLASGLGIKFIKWLNQKVFSLLPAAATTTGYDGQYIVDTDHSEGISGTQSNKSTTAFSAAEYASARAAMMLFKDDQGDPAGKMGNLLVVPPALEKTALETLKSVNVVSGGAAIPNVMQGTADVLVSRWLTDTNNWYLIDTSEDKPLILQERIPLEAGFQGADSHVGFNRSEYDYGTYWRGAFGYGDWRNIYGGIVA